jgi:hypothetical protein
VVIRRFDVNLINLDPTVGSEIRMWSAAAMPPL